MVVDESSPSRDGVADESESGDARVAPSVRATSSTYESEEAAVKEGPLELPMSASGDEDGGPRGKAASSVGRGSERFGLCDESCFCRGKGTTAR